MDKTDIDKIKFDEQGNFLRTEENLWGMIEILTEGMVGLSEVVNQMTEMAHLNSEILKKLVATFQTLDKK
jgi:hypothetical protein